MSLRVRSSWITLLLCGFLISSLAGCGSSGKDPIEELRAVNERNIQRITNLYGAYQSRSNWRGPEDEAEFKSFLKGFNPKRFTRLGIDPNKIEDLFISERDGEHFKIRYGVAGSMMGSDDPVVFEAVGIDGKREVGFLNMVTREVEAAEYDNLWAGNYESTGISRE